MLCRALLSPRQLCSEGCATAGHVRLSRSELRAREEPCAVEARQPSLPVGQHRIALRLLRTTSAVSNPQERRAPQTTTTALFTQIS